MGKEGLPSHPPKTSFHIAMYLSSEALNTNVSAYLCDDLFDVCGDVRLGEDGAVSISAHHCLSLLSYLARSRCSTNG